MADDSAVTHARKGEPLPATACLVRLGWLAGGNILLTSVAILIARSERWTLTAKDVAFWLILALAVALRYVDWRRFSATTADGEPATPHDLRRYAAVLVGTWSALWGLAQAVELG